MKLNSVFATFLGAAAVVGAVVTSTQQANAADLNGTWNYQYDAAGDGSGGSAYDIRGMAMTFRDGKVFVALNGGASLAGVQDSQSRNGSISWGDLFFNFSGKSFNDAAAAGQLFGVRFAESNDSPVALGVYSSVQTQSVATVNDGYSSLQQYYDYGWNKDQTQGSALATKEAAFNYYGTGSIQNSIVAGTKVGDISLLTANALADLGLNFGANAGSETFGFSFDRSLLGSGDFLANLYMECGNDGMAFQASAAPEPTTMAGVAVGIAGIAGLKRRRKQAAAK